MPLLAVTVVSILGRWALCHALLTRKTSLKTSFCSPPMVVRHPPGASCLRRSSIVRLTTTSLLQVLARCHKPSRSRVCWSMCLPGTMLDNADVTQAQHWRHTWCRQVSLQCRRLIGKAIWGVQGGDVGTQYRSAVYYHSPQQQAAAQKARRCGPGCMRVLCLCCGLLGYARDALRMHWDRKARYQCCNYQLLVINPY